MLQILPYDDLLAGMSERWGGSSLCCRFNLSYSLERRLCAGRTYSLSSFSPFLSLRSLALCLCLFLIYRLSADNKAAHCPELDAQKHNNPLLHWPVGSVRQGTSTKKHTHASAIEGSLTPGNCRWVTVLISNAHTHTHTVQSHAKLGNRLTLSGSVSYFTSCFQCTIIAFEICMAHIVGSVGSDGIWAQLCESELTTTTNIIW